mgnify:CR=1 FL=1
MATDNFVIIKLLKEYSESPKSYQNLIIEFLQEGKTPEEILDLIESFF